MGRKSASRLVSTALLAASPALHGRITRKPFGKTREGQPVVLYTLRNAAGAEVSILNYGGIIVSLKVPDRTGRRGDVVLGCDTLEDYRTRNAYFGCIVGRFANRIGGAKFEIDGKTYPLPTNDGPNTLHGGIQGFDKVVWKAKTLMTPDGPALELRYVSQDGEEGFPGRLSVKTLYTLTDKNEVRIDYRAATDKATIVNLTNHSFFNLAGAGNGDVLGHRVTINAGHFTPTDAGSIPTGEIRAVAGTPFDFSRPTAIGERIDAADQQIEFGGGYDQNFIINKPEGKLGLMARVYEPGSGRVLTVLGTQPGVQFYTGNFLDGCVTGKGGKRYPKRHGFCFEPQHYPDSPNKPQFPSPVLRPGETYKQTIIYRFSVQ